jgi:hypothetical protein
MKETNLKDCKTEDLQEMLARYYADADTLLLLDNQSVRIYHELKTRGAAIPMISRWEWSTELFPEMKLVYVLA